VKEDNKDAVVNANETEVEKDLITSEDVKKAISGDEQALIEQLERAKQVALEQLEASKKGIQVTGQDATLKTREELEREVALREKELEVAMINAGLTTEQKIITDNNIPQDKDLEIAKLNAQLTMNQDITPDKLAEEERKRKAEEAELDIKSRVEPIDTTRNLYINDVKAKKESAAELKKRKQEEALAKKKQKEQEALAAKQKKEQEILAKKQQKEQRALAKQKAKEERRANSNFKYIMTILLFIGLFTMVYYLPDISSYMSAYQQNKANQTNEIIKTGNLTCKLTKSNKKYDLEYKSIFAFTDSKLTKLTYMAKTKGDTSLDYEELTQMNEKCELLKDQTKLLNGITVKCSLSNGVNTNIQELDYANIDEEKVTTSYIEAGGTYPNYKYEDNIDKIEKEMNAAGYTCERTR